MRLVLAPALCALASTVTAYPGMKNTIAEIQARQADVEADTGDTGDSKELIGDLATLDDSQLTEVGRTVKEIITADGEPQSDEFYWGRLPPKGSAKCAADTCCIWKYISQDMHTTFRGRSGRCNGLARGAVRLGFHDCGGWSKGTGPLGGCDGSIILSGVEMSRGANRGLEEIVAQMQKWHYQYKRYGVSMADLIQMGATVATVTCPLGPRIRSYVGRQDSSTPATDGLLPPVTGSADFLVELFENKTIGPHGLTALIGAHTTSQQRFVDLTRSLDPQDSTPGVWDVAFYKETLGNAPKRVFRFASDIVLAKDSRISTEFQEFANDQHHWNMDYAREYIRLSLLGVYNINDLTECSKVLPPVMRSYRANDQDLMDKWMKTKNRVPGLGDAVRGGEYVTGYKSKLDNIVDAVFGKKFPW